MKQRSLVAAGLMNNPKTLLVAVSDGRSPASRRQNAGADPAPEKIERRRVAMATVERRRTECGAADRVRQSDRGAANRHGPHRKPAD
jgi:hypothetical protein